MTNSNEGRSPQGYVLYIPDENTRPEHRVPTEAYLENFIQTSTVNTLFKQENVAQTNSVDTNYKQDIAPDTTELENVRHYTTNERIRIGVVYTLIGLMTFYIFLVAIKFIDLGSTLVLGCETATVFEFANHPISALMLGIIATALVFNSSTVTSVIVVLVSANIMHIRQAVYAVMGSNLGSSISALAIAFGQVEDINHFRRGMAAALTQNIFNLALIAVIFPLEVAFSPLLELSTSIANFSERHDEKSTTIDGEIHKDFSSPVRAIVKPITKIFASLDTEKLQNIEVRKDDCDSSTTLLKSGLFHDLNLGHNTSGSIFIAFGLVLLLVTLAICSKVLGRVFFSSNKTWIGRLLTYNGYVSILLGAAITAVIQSSTIFVSTLIPVAGIGALTIEQIFPLVLGGNIGATTPALLAASATGRVDGLAIALMQFIYNVIGVLLFYPIYQIRTRLLEWATIVAFMCASWTTFAVLLIVNQFYIFPLVAFGIDLMCRSSSTEIAVLGYGTAGILILAIFFGLHWYAFQNGSDRWFIYLQRKRDYRNTHDLQEVQTQQQSFNSDIDIGYISAIC